MADTRVHVTLEDFLRVTIAERDEFDSVQDAADELGMTPASFKQRLIKSKNGANHNPLLHIPNT